MNEFKDKLNGIIDDSLRQPPDFIIPDSFTDKIMKRLEKQLAWKELFSELGIKLVLVSGALIILLVCLIFPAKNDPLPWINWIIRNRIAIIGLMGIGLFTVLFDQILLKFMFRKYKKSF